MYQPSYVDIDTRQGYTTITCTDHTRTDKQELAYQVGRLRGELGDLRSNITGYMCLLVIIYLPAMLWLML